MNRVSFSAGALGELCEVKWVSFWGKPDFRPIAWGQCWVFFMWSGFCFLCSTSFKSYRNHTIMVCKLQFQK